MSEAVPNPKRIKFRELVESRTNKAIEAIERISNLSNRQFYDYEDAEVKKVIRALREAVGKVEARFDAPRSKSPKSFRL